LSNEKRIEPEPAHNERAAGQLAKTGGKIYYEITGEMR
jgi:hypothetical protein